MATKDANTKNGMHNEQGVEYCPLCKTLRPEWCRLFSSEGHQPQVGIPVCVNCANIITEYMIDLRGCLQ